MIKQPTFREAAWRLRPLGIFIAQRFLAIPGKTLEMQENRESRTGRVQFGGITREVLLEFVPEARIGDDAHQIHHEYRDTRVARAVVAEIAKRGCGASDKALTTATSRKNAAPTLALFGARMGAIT